MNSIALPLLVLLLSSGCAVRKHPLWSVCSAPNYCIEEGTLWSPESMLMYTDQGVTGEYLNFTVVYFPEVKDPVISNFSAK